MVQFFTMIAQYNASLPTLADSEGAPLAQDSNARLILDHASSSIKIGNGSDLLDILAWDSASAGSENGLLGFAVRKDTATSLVGADGDFSPLQVDANGRLRVDAEVSVSTGSDKVEDEAHVSGDIGAYMLAVRSDSRPTGANVSNDGDYASIFINANGELYVKDTDTKDAIDLVKTAVDSVKTSVDAVKTSVDSVKTSVDAVDASIVAISKVEDDAHVSGDKGVMSLAVRKDVAGSLAGSDGDYAPLQVDGNGALRVNAAIDFTPGTEGDVGSDEAGDGEIPAVGTSSWVDIVSIPVTSGTYYVQAIDGSADKLCQFRLVTTVSTTPTKYHRIFNVTENNGTMQLTFPRAIEITGAANTAVVLQAKRLRSGSVDATCAGGINGYTL